MAYKGGRLLAPALADVGRIGALLAQKRKAAASAASKATTNQPGYYEKAINEALGKTEYGNRGFDNPMYDGVLKIKEAVAINKRAFDNGEIDGTEYNRLQNKLLTESQRVVAVYNGKIAGLEELDKGITDGTFHPMNREQIVGAPNNPESSTFTGYGIEKRGTFDFNDLTGDLEFIEVSYPKDANGIPIFAFDKNGDVIKKEDVDDVSFIYNEDFLSQSRDKVIEQLREAFPENSGYTFTEGGTRSFVIEDPNGNKINIRVKDPNQDPAKESEYIKSRAFELRRILGEKGYLSDGFIGKDGSKIEAPLEVRTPDYMDKDIPMMRRNNLKTSDLVDIGFKRLRTVDVAGKTENFAKRIADRFKVVSTDEPVILDEDAGLVKYVSVADSSQNEQIKQYIEADINRKYSFDDLVTLGYDLGMRGEYFSDRGQVMEGVTNDSLKERFNYLRDEKGNEIVVTKQDLIFKTNKNNVVTDLTDKQKEIIKADLRHRYTMTTGRDVDYYYTKISDAAIKEDEIKSAPISSTTIPLADTFASTQLATKTPISAEYAGKISEVENVVTAKGITKSLSIPEVLSPTMTKAFKGFRTYRNQTMDQITGVSVKFTNGKYNVFLIGPATIGQVERKTPAIGQAPEITQKTQEGIPSAMSGILNPNEVQRVYETLFKNNDAFQAAANGLGYDYKTANYGLALYQIFNQL